MIFYFLLEIIFNGIADNNLKIFKDKIEIITKTSQVYKTLTLVFIN